MYPLSSQNLQGLEIGATKPGIRNENKLSGGFRTDFDCSQDIGSLSLGRHDKLLVEIYWGTRGEPSVMYRFYYPKD